MYAAVFPGQGSQYVGMGKELYKSNPTFAKTINKADDILGFKLSQIMFSGSENELMDTQYSQLAIYIYSIALVNSNPNFIPIAVAGHSLGEYSALTAAKSLSFEDGLYVIRERARGMKKATLSNPGKMAAILGLEDELVSNVCKKTAKNVFIANYNCPGQIVISGTKDGVDMASKELKELGAKRIIELKVSGAFHTSMMKSASQELKNALDNVTFKKPFCPIYQNYNAKKNLEPEIIKYNLGKQMSSPVLWTQTIENMTIDGINNFQEYGPGKVLKGLIPRIIKNVEVSSFVL